MRWSERHVIVGLLALLAISCGLRFFGLDHDLGYDISSYSGTFITDEGWYHKSARSLALWREWGHAMDRNVYSHTPLFALWMASVFEVFGVSLSVARTNSILAFVVSLWILYLICRTRHGVVVSLAACLAVSATLHVVTFSRMAIVEPTGVALSLAALWLWIRYPARSDRWRAFGATRACLASITLAVGATFVKVGFVFTLGTVGLLWLADAAGLTAARSKAQAWRLVLVLAATGGLTLAVLFGVRDWAGRDWAEMQELAVYEQTGTVSLRDSLDYVYWSVEEFLLEEPQRLVLLVAAGLMAAAVLLPWTAAAARRRAAGRAWLAMALWAASGFVLFSMFEYRMPRYYYFLIFPLTFLALEGVAAFFALRMSASGETERGGRRLVAAVLAAHLLAQVPDWGRWLDREPSSSQADMARAVAARITSEEESTGAPPVLLGLNAAFVALFDDRIRPLELEFVDPEVLCRRIEWWRPPYFLHYESQFPDRLCPGIVRELVPLDYHTVMGRWYYDSDVVLARVVYGRAGSHRGPHAILEDPP